MARRKRRASKKVAKKATRRPAWTLLTMQHLEQARNSRHMSKAAWTRSLGISLSTYHNWLTGKGVPHVSKQRKLLSSLDAGSALSLLDKERQGELPTTTAEGNVLESVTLLVKTAIENGAPVEKVPELARSLRLVLEGVTA